MYMLFSVPKNGESIPKNGESIPKNGEVAQKVRASDS